MNGILKGIIAGSVIGAATAAAAAGVMMNPDNRGRMNIAFNKGADAMKDAMDKVGSSMTHMHR